MVFSSILFLYFFLPVFLITYHLIDLRYKNLVLLLGSLVFYSWGAPDFILIAVLSIAIDFYVVKTIHQSTSSVHRKLFLWLSILLNVGLLLYFKYANFFIENINVALGDGAIEWTEIVLPIGLSFFTFQKLSYSIDIYRNVDKPLDSLVDYTVYILLFPQLIAGPIVRYNEIASQLVSRETRNYDDRILGFYRFSIGLAKKVLIANVLGEKADLIFAMDTTDLTSSIAWFGVICYTFQIYFDFSGYSDMAIGLGRIMGFRFPENFNSPYISQSITEFWRRWHITLGSWMRDYLYIPLGGNKVKSKSRLYTNLWIVFLISGLWHGAAWNFIIWGAYHGLFLIADRVFLNKLTKHMGSLGRMLLTFIVVVLGWVLFRANDLQHSMAFYQAMFSWNFADIGAFMEDKVFRTLLIAGLISFGFAFKQFNVSYDIFLEKVNVRNTLTKGLVSLLLIVLSTSALVSSDFNPFIYFRF